MAWHTLLSTRLGVWLRGRAGAVPIQRQELLHALARPKPNGSSTLRFKRPCLQCNKLHQDKGDYCVSCRAEKERQRESDPKRIAHKRNLYNKNYQVARKLLVEQTILNNFPCHICKLPFLSRADITADHLEAGNPNSALAPAHRACNSRRGNAPLT